MSLLINKNGNQLGPFSLNQARNLVLSGELSSDDWVWEDGASDWVQLRDISGFTTPETNSQVPPTAGSAFVKPAAEIELWHGHPSQALNADVYVFWIAAFVVTAAVLGWTLYKQMIDSWMWAGIIFGIVFLIGVINIAIAYFHLRAIEYFVTNQRVRVIAGFFGKNIQEIELFRVKDTMAQQSFFLRLFGLGTITIVSGDERNPRLVLSGVPDAIALREKLRTEVMVLRQRFGVREVDVM